MSTASSGPVTTSPLVKRVSTRLTEADAMKVHHIAKLRGATEEQMLRLMVRRFIFAYEKAADVVVPDVASSGR